MNKQIMKQMGFDKEVELKEQSRCPFCKREVTENDFTDEASRFEYKISGLCQECQDYIFGRD